jgi:hypothetical protein
LSEISTHTRLLDQTERQSRAVWARALRLLIVACTCFGNGKLQPALI